MKRRKFAYFLMTISFILIISGGVASFVLGLKSDKRATYKRVQVVNDEFEIFSTNTSLFEDYRDELYNVVFNELFYDTMLEQDSDVKLKLDGYEKLVNQITDNKDKLVALCDNIYFPSSDANSKCTNYKSIYEQVINYFVADIEYYNKVIDEYNEYQKNMNSDKSINKYSTNKKYIDYNKDGKMDGKEE